MLVNVELEIHLVHTPGVEKDQEDKDVDRTLLCKPESQLESAKPYAIQLIDEQNAEAVRANEPDNHAAK